MVIINKCLWLPTMFMCSYSLRKNKKWYKPLKCSWFLTFHQLLSYMAYRVRTRIFLSHKGIDKQMINMKAVSLVTNRIEKYGKLPYALWKITKQIQDGLWIICYTNKYTGKKSLIRKFNLFPNLSTMFECLSVILPIWESSLGQNEIVFQHLRDTQKIAIMVHRRTNVSGLK